MSSPFCAEGDNVVESSFLRKVCSLLLFTECGDFRSFRKTIGEAISW